MNSLMLKLEEFRNIVDKIYGVYLDSTTGFQTIVGQAISSEKLAQENIIEFQKSHSEYAHYNLPTSDEMTHWYGRIVKKRHKNRAMHLHQCSFSELKDRNHPQGDNFRFIANMCLVIIYQYWEDHYRKAIAESLGCLTDSVQIPVFGDLRRLRRSIIHNRGIATSDMCNCEVFRWFQSGEEIFLDLEKFEAILDAILECIDQLRDNPQQYVRTT